MELKISRDGLSYKQLLLLNAVQDYVLFGGARGGGKTHVLRIGAVEHALMYPGRKIGFVRPTIKSAREQFGEAQMSEIIPRSIKDPESKEIIPIWKYNGQDAVYKFANGPDPINPFDGGSKILLCGVTTLKDAQDAYQGIEFVSIWWDELTKANYDAYIYMRGSLRDRKYPVLFRAASNPGEKSHKEVKAEFVAPWEKIKRMNKKNYPEDYNGKISWKRSIYDEKSKTEIPNTFAYIPATLDDNPIKNIREQYLRVLSNLPEHLRQMYRFGSWDTYEGKYFESFDESKVVKTPKQLMDEYGIDLEYELGCMRVFMSMDWGYHDFTAVYWHLESSKGAVITFKSLYLNKTLMEDVAKTVQEMNDRMGLKPHTIYMPWDLYLNKGGEFKTRSGIAIGDQLIDVWRFYNKTPDIKTSNDRKQGWINMTSALTSEIDTTSKMVDGSYAKVKIPKWILIKGENKELLEQINSAQVNPKDPEDILKGRVDHALDACRCFWVGHIIDPKIIEKLFVPPDGTGARIRYELMRKKEKAKKRRRQTFF